MEPKKGFFDKVNNAFFSVIDVFLSLLEEKGWNIPEETRFLYHTAVFIFVFWLGFPLILQYFFEFEILVILLALASFCIANIMPIRKLLGYYSSEEKIHALVGKIKENKVSIKEVSEHLSKNLLPPSSTISIIKAYREKGSGIPPEIIRLIIRQPQETTVFAEVIKEQLNESDFSLLMRKYRNEIPKSVFPELVKNQKMNALTIKDLLFYQENAYQSINEIGKKAEDSALMDFVIKEKHRYKEKVVAKNFLRNHQLGISLFVPTLLAALSIPLVSNIMLLAAAFAVIWVIAFEALYNFGIREIYFKL